MTVYTTVPADDSNLDVVVTEANDIVKIDIQPASFNSIGSVDSVNGLAGVVLLDTDDIPEGVNKYYTDAKVQTVINTNSADFATTTYVNDEDDAVEVAANLYTDNAVTGLAATTYVNTQDGVTLSSANTYTDTSIAAIPAVDLSAYETIVNSEAGDATTLSSANTYTDTSIAAIPAVDLSSYETIVNSEAGDATTLSSANTYTDTSIAAIPATDLSAYSTTVQVEALPVSTFTNDAGYITTETDSQTLSFATPNISISGGNSVDLTPLTLGYITADSTNTLTNKSGAISQWTNDSAYLTGSALTPYSTTVQVEALPVSTFTNDAGYLTTETDSQTLSFATPNLTISNGNTVDLSALTPTVPVTSVNTLTGDVVLDTDDVLEGANKYYTDAKVQTVINTNTAGYATTTYVDTEDATTLSSANTYTDNSIAAIPATDLSAYSTTVQVEALPVSTFTNDSGYSTTTYVDTNDATTLSSANTYTDTSIAAIDLTVLDDVTQINPDSSGMTIGATGVTTAKWGSSAPLFWRSDNDDGALKNFVFDNTNQNIFVGMHWKTADSNKKLFRFDATATGGTDPGDGSHTTNFTMSGTNNIFKSRLQNETKTGLEFNADNINLVTDNGVSINSNYTLPNVDGTAGQVLTTDGNGNLSWETP